MASQEVASSSEWKLELKSLPILRRLGQGFSGYFYETAWGGKKCARKDFPLGSVERNQVFEKEAKSLFTLDHPNIVKCYGYTIGKNSCSLLQEYVDGNLQNTIQRGIEAQRKNSETLIEGSSKMPGSGSTITFEMPGGLDIISQIATGVKYLHDHRVPQGDLKPKNVLLYSESGEMKVKVADFGLVETKKRVKLVSKRTRHFEILTWKAPQRLEKLLGPVTEDSDDPFTDSDSDEEIGSSNDFLESGLAMSDVYSFGLTCSHIMGGKLLYPDLSLTQLRKQRMDGFEPELPPTCPEYLKFIIHSCLQFEPLSRPTFSAICTLKGLLPHIGGLLCSMTGKDLMALKTLHLDGYSRLLYLPSEIGNLTALTTLSLDGCSRLEHLPSEIGNLITLTTLSLNYYSNLEHLPSEISNLRTLTTLSLKGCSRLEHLPSEIGNLMALTTLSLDDCSNLLCYQVRLVT